MGDSQEKLEVLNMIKNGTVSPEQGMRLIEAIESSGKKDSSPESSREGPRWLNIEIRTKASGKYKSLTPIRIPMSLLKLFFRFIPKDSSVPGSGSSLEGILELLETGKPLDLYTEEGEEGRSVRITAE